VLPGAVLDEEMDPFADGASRVAGMLRPID
jgi:hypothetical protein